MIRLLAVLLVLPAGLFAEDKGKQYAFLVGCSGYSESKLTPLPYTVRDVEQFRQSLLDTGFEADNVKMLHDKQERRFLSEKAKIVKEFAMLLDGLKPEDTVIVALSGHGVQLKKEGISYFCPLDADLEDKNTLIPLDGKDGLFDQLKGCPAKRKLLIVNACRDVRDIPGKRAQAAEKIDLEDFASAAVPEGIAAIYSCKAGQKSYYDPKREGGIFFDHVNRAWRGEYSKDQNETTIEDFFREVSSRTKIDVDKTYGESQIPEVKREYKEEWKLTSGGIAAEYRQYETLTNLFGPENNWLREHAPKRFKEWRRLAEGGNVKAMYLIGSCYELGQGTEKDEKQAFHWCSKAADLGNILAMDSIGYYLQTGMGVPKDEKESIKWFRKAIDLGNTAAMVSLGVCHQNGIGVGKDEKLAAELFRKVADLGSPLAMTQLGSCHQNGLGVEKDEKKAVDLYRKAAELGYDHAMTLIGICYQNGTGVATDEKEAVRWYLKAAAHNDDFAMLNLGYCHLNGTGVAKDEKKAFDWFQKVVDLGSVSAPSGMERLGVCYQFGFGVAKDEKQAIVWYRKAAAQGVDAAMYSLGSLYQYGSAAVKDEKEAVVWYRKVAEKEYEPAMFSLALCFEYGNGVGKDEKQAAEWYQKCAKLGNKNALEGLERLAGKKPPSPLVPGAQPPPTIGGGTPRVPGAQPPPKKFELLPIVPAAPPPKTDPLP